MLSGEKRRERPENSPSGDQTYYSLRALITTSRRKSQLTNTFVKGLSLLLNAPIIRRGSSNLKSIALQAIEEDFDCLIVVYTARGNPSVLTFYRRAGQRDSPFVIHGRLFLMGFYLDRHIPAFECLKLVLESPSTGGKKVFNFLRDLLHKEEKAKCYGINLIVKDFGTKELEKMRRLKRLLKGIGHSLKLRESQGKVGSRTSCGGVSRCRQVGAAG